MLLFCYKMFHFLYWINNDFCYKRIQLTGNGADESESKQKNKLKDAAVLCELHRQVISLCCQCK